MSVSVFPSPTDVLHPALRRLVGPSTTHLPVRRLNDKGTELFRSWACSGGVEGRKKGNVVATPPYGALFDSTCSSPVRYHASVDLRPLRTMSDVANMVNDGFGDEMELLREDKGVLDWISLLRIDELYPASDKGTRRGKSPLRYLFRDFKRKAAGYDMAYRHLVWSAAFIRRDLAGRGDIFLAAPASQPGDLAEAILARPVVRSSPGLLDALTLMYFDEGRGSLTPGAKKSKKRKDAALEGGIRDFVGFVNSFWKTNDIDNMSMSEVLDLAPPEGVFGPHVGRARLKLAERKIGVAA